MCNTVCLSLILKCPLIQYWRGPWSFIEGDQKSCGASLSRYAQEPAGNSPVPSALGQLYLSREVGPNDPTLVLSNMTHSVNLGFSEVSVCLKKGQANKRHHTTAQLGCLYTITMTWDLFSLDPCQCPWEYGTIMEMRQPQQKKNLKEITVRAAHKQSLAPSTCTQRDSPVPSPVQVWLLVVEQESSSHWLHWLLAAGELVNLGMAVTDQCLCSICSQPCQASCFPHVSTICSLQLISWWSTQTAVLGHSSGWRCWSNASPAAGVRRAVTPPPTAASPAHKGGLVTLHGSKRVQSPGSWGEVISLPICWRLDKLSHSLRLHSRDTRSCTASLLHAGKAKVTFNCAWNKNWPPGGGGRVRQLSQP